MKKNIRMRKPRYLQTFPHYVIELPWVVACRTHVYNKNIHAAVHSIIAGLKCHSRNGLRYWLREGHRQLSQAIKELDRASTVIRIPK